MVFLYVSSERLWDCYGISMEFLWCFYGTPMICRRGFYGISLEILLGLSGIPMGFLWLLWIGSRPRPGTPVPLPTSYLAANARTLSHHCGHESKRFLHIEPIEEVGCSCKGGPWLDAVAIDTTIGILKNFYGVPLGFLWNVYDISMGLLWDFKRVPEGFPWYFYENFYGISIRFL
jgi:hypothetical protein